ncbi:MAG: GNAT family N-acetyltransferase [Candidatus Izemoplasmatales bacterium]|nr:GNAT family N-acetyltransferase [Candidatus Izemoplasmatales bacterium]
MIRILNKQDCSQILNYLYQESTYNIFPIGDIETFGFDKDFQHVYAEIDNLGNYLSAFLRYRENAIYYSHKLHFNKQYLEIFKQDSFNVLSGKAELLNILDPYLTGYKKTQMYFCQAQTIKVLDINNSYNIKQLESREECNELFNLLTNIKEFNIYHNNRSNFVEAKLNSLNMGITLFIEKGNHIVSTVATTAETTKSAMVVSVATDIRYRNQGLASILMIELMKKYITEKKKDLCLFYDNPEAGKIYQRLGFEYLGMWNMYKLINNKSN